MRNFLERQMWVDFGKHPNGDVDIVDTDGRDVATLPATLAEAVIKAHNDALDRADDDLTALDPWPNRG